MFENLGHGPTKWTLDMCAYVEDEFRTGMLNTIKVCYALFMSIMMLGADISCGVIIIHLM